MICDNCNEREANVHIKKIENGQVTEYNLCQECAAQMGEMPVSFPDFQSSIFGNLSDMLAGFSDAARIEKVEAEKKCPGCGQTFSDFQNSGRLGCGECYDTFEKSLNLLLQRIQGATQHAGKSPLGIEEKAEIVKLKEELKKAVEAEEYERAAVIRDKIRELEKKK